VLASDGTTVLGTVSMCLKDPREPNEHDFQTIDVALYLMGLAIERSRNERLILAQQMKLVASSKKAAPG